MSHTFQIIADSALSLIGLFFLGWLVIRSIRRNEDPARQIFKWIITAVVIGFAIKVVGPMLREGGYGAAFIGVPLSAVCGLVLAVIWRHNIIDLVANPITSLYDGGTVPPEPKPYYSIAISKRKSNKPLEAVIEIRKQLANFPDDFEGVMLLAGIQAEDLKDLPSAEMTLNHFCDRPEAPPKQAAAAFGQLADWHLKLAQDEDSARAALEKIIAKFPGTELALQTAQRIAHLGGTKNQLLAAQDRQPVFVPEGVKNIGLLDSSEHLIPVETGPAELAGIYVKHLEQHPDDTEAREKLAVIYANHYQRLDLAAGELNQLAEQPNQPPKRVAHWLNLLADLQVRHGADYETVRATLEKINERFPDLPVAEIARSRLGRLKLEIKGQKETPGIKLGVYEQNIGLKYGSPRQL